ncbi:MAG: MFS transporter [Candidatus Hodarchaeota archaeon]
MENVENAHESIGSNNKKLLIELVPFIIFIFLNGSSGYAFFGFAPALLEELGISEGYISLILLSQPITIMLFSSLFGRLSDEKRTRKKLMVLGLLVKVINYVIFYAFVISGVRSVIAYLFNYLTRGVSIALSSCESAWFSDFTLEMNGGHGVSKSSSHSGISYYFLITSISWASGTVIIGWLIELFGLTSLGILVLIFAGLGFIPLLFIKEKYAESCEGSSKVVFNYKQDIKDLDQGKLIYPAIALKKSVISAMMSAKIP